MSPVSAKPLPLSGTEAALVPRVEEEIASVAVLPPALLGVKVTCTLHCAPGASVSQVLALQAKQYDEPLCVQLAEGLVMVKPIPLIVAPPVLVMVKPCSALVWPTDWLVKLRLAGLALKVGGVNPVPDKATVLGESAALLATVSVPL